MNKPGICLLATVGLTGLAHAADILPTTKAPPPPPPVNCYASFWSWLDSTAADCPLSYAGFTVYATLDAGLMYNTNGAPWNPAFVNGAQGLISKQSHGVKWLWSPNNINQSVIGIKMVEPIGYGWSLVGTLEAGFDPLSGYLANSQRSQVENNGRALVLQSANGNSSRAGQWDNSQGFLGVSNKTYGTLVFGRVNALPLDELIAYDPLGAAYAFSPFGFTGAYAGFSDTELARSNTAFKYRVDISNFRAGALAQVGGYDQGNGSASMWQGQLGGDFGALSVDGVVSYAKDGVNTGLLTGSCALLAKGPFAGQTGCSYAIPLYYTAEDLKATLSNNTGAMLAAKYKWGAATLYGGYESFRQANPSDTYPNGFKTIGGYSVPGNVLNNKNLPDRLDHEQRLQYQQDREHLLGRSEIRGQRSSRRDRRVLLYRPEQLFDEPVHRDRNPHQQRRLRRVVRHAFLPGRLSPGQTDRYLRRRRVVERVRRSRQRLPRGPEHRPDRRPAHQVLNLEM